MSRAMRITADPRAVCMAAAIRAAPKGTPLVTVTHRALRDLARELGSMDAAAAWLADLANEIGRPVSVNVPTSEHTSSTVFLPPQGWSQERLRGWAAGKREELEAAFGDAVGMRSGA